MNTTATLPRIRDNIKYPNDLVDYLRANWYELVGNIPTLVAAPTDMPDPAILERLVGEVFLTSFRVEESRSIQMSVMLVQRGSLSHLCSLNNRGLKPWELHHKVISFGQTRPFSSHELMRLAPATDFRKTLICVQETAPGQPDNDLEIWGLYDHGFDQWRWENLEKLDTAGLPGNLILKTPAQGAVEVYYAQAKLINLRDGRIYEPRHSSYIAGPEVREFFRPFIASVVADVLENLDHVGDLNLGRALIDGYKIPLTVVKVLNRVKDARHGGAIFLIEEANLDKIDDYLDIKYPIADVQGGLLRQVIGYRIHHRAQALLAQQSSAEPYLAEDLYRNDENMEDVISFVSQLSAVDGAVLLTDQLRLVGFGAVVRDVNIGGHILEAREDGVVPVRTDDYGTRHRSAFSFCRNFPGRVLAFIVSQDGGVKAVSDHNGQLVLYKDVL